MFRLLNPGAESDSRVNPSVPRRRPARSGTVFPTAAADRCAGDHIKNPSASVPSPANNAALPGKSFSTAQYIWIPAPIET